MFANANANDVLTASLWPLLIDSCCLSPFAPPSGGHSGVDPCTASAPLPLGRRRTVSSLDEQPADSLRLCKGLLALMVEELRALSAEFKDLAVERRRVPQECRPTCASLRWHGSSLSGHMESVPVVGN